jgi:hypothetical protein
MCKYNKGVVMKKYLSAAFLIIPFFLFAIVDETASLKNFIFGQTENTEYDNYLSHVSEGIASENYNIYAPWDRQTNGFGNYHLPTETEQNNWSEITNAFVNQNYETAESLIGIYGFPYEVVNFHDTDTGRNYYMLREQLDMSYYDDNGTDNLNDDELGSFSYGWGLYIFSPDSSRPIIITTPHVNDDFTTGAIAIKCFEDWNARFLLMSGAGREVLWTNSPPYYNSKSLSDASRIQTHPLNIGYKKACDEIRTTLNHRELSFQIHGYDWNRHENHTACQVSAGNGNNHPDLPIRDLSNEHNDLINNTPYIVHPANSIGFNNEETIEDFYSVNYSEDNFFYYQSENDSLEISNGIDLPGYSQNRQMQYSCSGWNDYDIFDPFFHIEMDELPNCYPQTISNYYWFYGYNPDIQSFEINHVFDKTFEFYNPWINSITVTLNHYFEYSDPNPPLQIANIEINFTNYNRVGLKWNRTSDFDFDSYQILYSTEPIENNNYQIYDRDNEEMLATQTSSFVTISNLEANQQYYFRLRAKDKAGHYSELSNEINDFIGVVNVSNFTATGLDNQVELRWYASHKENLAGFIIERKNQANNEFLQISSYVDNPNLLADAVTGYYYFYDENVVQDNFYFYRIVAVDLNGNTYNLAEVKEARPEHIFALEVCNQNSGICDTVYFGKNYYATNSTDLRFDIVNNSTPDTPYVKARFVTAFNNTNATRYIRQISAEYDQEHDIHSWLLTVKTSLTNEPLRISILNPERDAERLYLKRGNNLINLQDTIYTFTPTSSAVQNMTVYWGNYIPSINFTVFENRIYQPGEICSINWTTSLNSLISTIDLYAENNNSEIFITGLLSNDINSYDWVIPENFGDDYHFKINAHLLDGDIQTYISSGKIGIVAPEFVFSGNNGWKLFSDPIIQNSFTPEEIFGTDGLVYCYFNNNYYEVNEINANLPYWVYTENGYNAVVEGNFERTNRTINLNYGWNFVSNYHPITYNIGQLLFVHNNINYTFSEAVQSHLILPKCYDYDSKFVETSEILPGKSFWIYSFIDDLDLVMNPYSKLTAVTNFNNDEGQNLDINLRWNDNNNTKLTILTSNNFSDNFDFGYDIVKYPKKPNIVGNEAYFISESGTQTYELSSIAKHLLSENSADELNVILHITIPDSIHTFMISLGNNSFPQNYNVILEDNENAFNLDGNETILTQDSIEQDYILRIRNQFVSNTNNVNSMKFVTKNFPNPFRASNSKNSRGTGTNIFFNLPESTPVSLAIYNIRGQKVKEIITKNIILNKGTHTYFWDGLNRNNKNVASGVYFYKLKAGKNLAIKKILLLK